MARIISNFPLHITPEEQTAGFRHMILSLGNFVGAFPSENLEVTARRLSEFDVLLKIQSTSSSGVIHISYRHLRFGHPIWSEQIRIFWNGIRFGWWRSWFRGHLPWRVDWQHIPYGSYENPADDCLRSLSYHGIAGHAFCDYTA
jgi:hypothetical protein